MAAQWQIASAEALGSSPVEKQGQRLEGLGSVS